MFKTKEAIRDELLQASADARIARERFYQLVDLLDTDAAVLRVILDMVQLETNRVHALQSMMAYYDDQDAPGPTPFAEA